MEGKAYELLLDYKYGSYQRPCIGIYRKDTGEITYIEEADLPPHAIEFIKRIGLLISRDLIECDYDGVNTIKKCPRCGNEYKGEGCLDRTDNKTEICNDCGTAQAMNGLSRRE